jgi:hypothetical protein
MLVSHRLHPRVGIAAIGLRARSKTRGVSATFPFALSRGSRYIPIDAIVATGFFAFHSLSIARKSKVSLVSIRCTCS